MLSSYRVLVVEDEPASRYTYDRFVAHGRFCVRREIIEPAWMPAGDGPQCFVGYAAGSRSEGFADGSPLVFRRDQPASSSISQSIASWLVLFHTEPRHIQRRQEQ
jgi:hypothetical protein